MKKKLSKRGVLILINAIFFAVTLTVFILILYGTGYFNYNPKIDDSEVLREILYLLFEYMLIQSIFTFFSLVVYYLSIMSGALDKKYNVDLKDRLEKEKI